jgi:4-hydroxy-2-oxoheptanedioate aldolase
MGEYVNKIKRSKEVGKPILGLSLYSFSPTIAETAGYSGAEFIFVDNEHSPASWETLENIMRACDTSGATSLIRVDKQFPGYPSNIRRAFEIGAGMVLVPHINSRDEALSVVRAAKFGPGWKTTEFGDQVRGTGLLSRSGRYGTMQMSDWVKLENERRLVSIMLEEKRSLDNADEILSVDGLDQFIVGYSDLSSDLGIPGDKSDEKMKEMVEKLNLIEKKYPNKFVKSTNIDFVKAFVNENELKKEIKKKLNEGFTIFNLTHDLSIIRIVINKCKDILDVAYNEFLNESKTT